MFLVGLLTKSKTRIEQILLQKTYAVNKFYFY